MFSALRLSVISLLLALCAFLSVSGEYYADHHDGHGHHDDYHHEPAKYDFHYAVHDSHTGDIKHQHESRHGDTVHGEYSLVEPDGHVRTVKYNADHKTGFHAQVDRKEGYHY